MNGTLISRARIDSALRQRMFDLFKKHFENPDEEQFRRDLDEKNWVILLRDGHRLVGFSTILVYKKELEVGTATILYSGDTIMDPVAWSSSVLARTWFQAADRLSREAGNRRTFWLLLTSGFRTYRFLPVFHRQFFPRFDRSTPPEAQRMLHSLARERFGRLYLPERGIVRFDPPPVLQESLRPLPANRRRDPHVEFFRRANPGHEHGDELVCLAEFAPWNFTRVAQRIIAASSQPAAPEAAAG